jgi:hypothetical protein
MLVERGELDVLEAASQFLATDKTWRDPLADLQRLASGLYAGVLLTQLLARGAVRRDVLATAAGTFAPAAATVAAAVAKSCAEGAAAASHTVAVVATTAGLQGPMQGELQERIQLVLGAPPLPPCVPASPPPSPASQQHRARLHERAWGLYQDHALEATAGESAATCCKVLEEDVATAVAVAAVCYRRPLQPAGAESMGHLQLPLLVREPLLRRLALPHLKVRVIICSDCIHSPVRVTCARSHVLFVYRTPT